MTEQYYYTDPLAAAWMARHFGMKFKKRFGFEGEFPPNDMGENADHYINSKRQWVSNREYRIHPDSHHTLEPQVGDLCQYIMLDINWEPTGEHEIAEYRQCYPPDDRFEKIIQRNGIPFMWPELERM